MSQKDYIIRQETKEDLGETYTLIKTAFETAKVKDGTEADFALGLRQGHGFIPELSLVAEAEGRLVGHILLTKTHVEQPDETRYEALLVAPLSVALEWRDKGVGSALMREGLEIARKLGYGAAFLVGDPEYYKRFGFRPTADFGIGPKSDIPARFVMVRELIPDALRGVSGSGEFC